MILNIKKKLQIIFKNIGYKVFFHIYGKIISTISPENNNQIKVSKVSFINNSTYRIFEISNLDFLFNLNNPVEIKYLKIESA